MTSRNNNPQNHTLIPQDGAKEISVPNEQPMPNFVATRLHTLKQHIEVDFELMAEYETLLQEEDDPDHPYCFGVRDRIDL